MFERYTQRAGRVLFVARYEADLQGSQSIETEHLLLALIREMGGMTSRLLAHAGVSTEDIWNELGASALPRLTNPAWVVIPIGARLRRVLMWAAEEADGLWHSYIGTEHLLLAVLRDQGSAAARVLIDRGMSVQSTRQDIVRVLDSPPSPGEETVHRPVPDWHGERSLSDIPASYDLHVARMNPTTPQGQFTSGGANYFQARGFTAGAILARLLNVNETRVAIPAGPFRRERYEFKLRLPAVEPRHAIHRRVLNGIEDRFRVSIARERRLLDVYVLTAPHGEMGAPGRPASQNVQGPAEQPKEKGVRPRAVGPLFIPRSTLADLVGALEEMVGRPIVDETRLEGRYDIELEGNHDVNAFTAALQNQLGLTLTETRRELEMVTVTER